MNMKVMAEDTYAPTSLCRFRLIATTEYDLMLALNCEEIKQAESVAKFTPEELGTLEDDELNSCFTLLGKDKLTFKQAETLWSLILKSKGPADQILEEELRLLGWVSKGIPPGQFLNMSFTDIDTVAAFGHYYDLSFEQLSALHDAVMDQWSYKDISDLSSFDISNLGHILCAFNSSDIAMIHPDAYRDAAKKLSLLKNCSADVIKSLAALAINNYGFGDPSKWTALQVSSIGCVMAGIPDILSIPSEAFKGITPDIVDCLPKTVFQSMSESQLRMLSASSGIALGDAGLSEGQGAALEQAITGPVMENSAFNPSPGIWLLICLSLTAAFIKLSIIS